MRSPFGRMGAFATPATVLSFPGMVCSMLMAGVLGAGNAHSGWNTDSNIPMLAFTFLFNALFYSGLIYLLLRVFGRSRNNSAGAQLTTND
jgi:hypothetical protein